MSGHLSREQLALLAGHDLSWWEGWAARVHLSSCPGCKSTVTELRESSQLMRELADELPAGLDWKRLSAEMTGNIRVGLAAGECVTPRHRTFAPIANQRWGFSLLFASLTLLVAAALWINSPEAQVTHLRTAFATILRGNTARSVVRASEGVLLEASPVGIDVNENGGTLSLLQPHSDRVSLSVSMPASINTQGSAGARFIDTETGQVTINKVYYAQ